MNRRAFGNDGEDAACAYLMERGWKIVARNVRRGSGEIDVIARKGRLTAFVEVKRRSGGAFGTPAEAVNAAKRRRIVQAAAIWAQETGIAESAMRFDVIEIYRNQIRHIEGAFDATDLF